LASIVTLDMVWSQNLLLQAKLVKYIRHTPFHNKVTVYLDWAVRSIQNTNSSFGGGLRQGGVTLRPSPMTAGFASNR
jgi:hypothetical protein